MRLTLSEKGSEDNNPFGKDSDPERRPLARLGTRE
jgi:hypothetical protein